MPEPLVVSVREAARALGVSDDLVYEMTERGELPCVRFGRRKLVPVRAIELVVERCLTNFEPGGIITRIGRDPIVDSDDSA